MILLDLFLGFLKVGCFAFGGAYGAIPLIRDVVLDYGWLTEDQLTYMIGVSESTPGPIMVNLATYVGSSQGGILGSLLATLAVVLPSYCIILLILVLLKNIIRNPNVQAVLGGMQPCIIGIIMATGVQLSVKACFPQGSADLRALVIAAALAGIIVFCKKTKRKISPIRLIAISALLGIAFYGI